MPSAPMVRPNLTTSFRTKNIEDLENTIIHSFSEEGDWILDICCGPRELSLVSTTVHKYYTLHPWCFTPRPKIPKTKPFFLLTMMQNR